MDHCLPLFLHVQVEGALRDEQRSVAKSRMPLQESRRPGRPLPGETANHEYDLEVFDDRMFYSMLLKVVYRGLLCLSPRFFRSLTVCCVFRRLSHPQQLARGSSKRGSRARCGPATWRR